VMIGIGWLIGVAIIEIDVIQAWSGIGFDGTCPRRDLVAPAPSHIQCSMEMWRRQILSPGIQDGLYLAMRRARDALAMAHAVMVVLFAMRWWRAS
jgi:hypothetical protein